MGFHKPLIIRPYSTLGGEVGGPSIKVGLAFARPFPCVPMWCFFPREFPSNHGLEGWRWWRWLAQWMCSGWVDGGYNPYKWVENIRGHPRNLTAGYPKMMVALESRWTPLQVVISTSFGKVVVSWENKGLTQKWQSFQWNFGRFINFWRHPIILFIFMPKKTRNTVISWVGSFAGSGKSFISHGS